MNNLIKILLYSLLALLVVAISVMIYRRTQPEATVAETVADASDSLFLDPSFVANGPLTKEDSMILDLTGDLVLQERDLPFLKHRLCLSLQMWIILFLCRSRIAVHPMLEQLLLIVLRLTNQLQR